MANVETSSILVDRITANWRMFYQNLHLEEDLLRNASMRSFCDAHITGAIFQMYTDIAGERMEEIRYPRDWYQAIRQRFFPSWWLRRFPVRCHIWKVDFLYPEIEKRREMKPIHVAIYGTTVKSAGYLEELCDFCRNKQNQHFRDSIQHKAVGRAWVRFLRFLLQLSAPDED